MPLVVNHLRLTIFAALFARSITHLLSLYALKTIHVQLLYPRNPPPPYQPLYPDPSPLPYPQYPGPHDISTLTISPCLNCRLIPITPLY